MEKAKQFNSYKDFLHDKVFILWILTGSPKLEQYWKTFLNDHPEAAGHFNEAIHHSANIKLNQSRMSNEEHESLRMRIRDSSTVARQKRKLKKWLWWIVALCSCALLAFLLSG